MEVSWRSVSKRRDGGSIVVEERRRELVKKWTEMGMRRLASESWELRLESIQVVTEIVQPDGVTYSRWRRGEHDVIVREGERGVGMLVTMTEGGGEVIGGTVTGGGETREWNTDGVTWYSDGATQPKAGDPYSWDFVAADVIRSLDLINNPAFIIQ